MKQILNVGILFFLVCIGTNQLQAQVFWTETFGVGCNTGTLADGHTTSQGEWTVEAPTSTNSTNANVWYISAEENGEGLENCGGVGCGNKPTLHIGTNGADNGATYLSGGGDVATATKAVSPIIDGSGQCSIQLSFEFLGRGDGVHDYLQVLYFDGTNWDTIQDVARSPFDGCPSATWKERKVNLPASADNNPNIQIGFYWVNNDDNVGTDPSAAITNIQLAKNVTEAPDLICPTDIVQCDPVVTYSDPYVDSVGNCVAPPYTLSQNDGTGLTSGDTYPVGSTHQSFNVEDAMGNLGSCSFTVEILESPSIADITTPEEDVCDQQGLFLEATSPDDGNGEWSVIQGSSSINNPTQNEVQANNLPYGVNTYVWKVTSSSCGTTYDTLSIENFEPPSQASTQDIKRICEDTITSIVGNHPQVGEGAFSIANGTASFIDSTDNHTDIYNISEGWSDVIWTIRNGVCPSTSDTLHIFKKTNAEIYNSDTTICLLNDQLYLEGSPIVEEVSGGWYVAEGAADFENQGGSSVVINHLQEGKNIIVYGNSHQKCGTTTDSIIVIAEQCEEYDPKIPTMITPNGDGKNDFFIVENLHSLYPDAQVKIVNRWGNLVFESTGYAEPWNGTFMNDGKKLPMGTYFYRILIKEEDSEITGSISIIR